MPQCVVNFSGGAGSYVAAKRAIAKYGPDETVLLFADTKTEDEDLYRFLDDCERVLPAKLIRVADGRDIWQLFKDVRFLGNNRVAPCTTQLKKKVSDDWYAANAPNAIRVFGIDVSEIHRAKRLEKALSPIKTWFPLLEKPFLTKQGCFDEIASDGIKLPRLYTIGAPHNNCGGACVKAGMAHWRWLYHALPCVYAEWERKEQEMRDYLDADVSILRDRTGEESSTLTLADFRKRIEAKAPTLWDEEWGGCGCFTDTNALKGGE